MGTTISATLAIDEAVAARRAAGHDVLHLGFGEAGLPVPGFLREVLASAAARNEYGPVAGDLAVREAAAGWFTRRGLPTTGGQVMVGPGSKPLLFAALGALDGDVVLPRPAWVSYAVQAALWHRRVIQVPIGAAGGVPDPTLLGPAIDAAIRDGARPGVLVLTVPDNPTGTFPSAQDLAAVCAIADRYGLTVLSDEIYAPLVHGETAAPSAAAYLPDRTVVTSGLSKSLALGGWRIGYARVPDTAWGREVRRAMLAIASEIWSNVAAPMQSVATYALADPPEVTAHIRTAARLHSRIATAVHGQLLNAGAACRPPQAGFYLYPDFADLRTSETAGDEAPRTGDDLAAWLLDRHDVAVLPGTAFGDVVSACTVRIATSLLYGSTEEQRWNALAAEAPETLPWIAASLTRLGDALADLTVPALRG